LESFQVVLEYKSKINLKDAFFVFCIYLPSGVCASQWIASNQLLNNQCIEKEGEIVFSGESLYLGKGSYVASAAIFKHFSNDGLEPEAYHLLDRCIHFQVCDRTETDQTDYGICRQPIDVKVKIYA
jgi:lipopolysaccharide transport system ATP-binding protein